MSFPKYPEYKDSGVEWLGEVPAHWEIPKLKYLARIRNGRDYKEVEVESGGYPVIGSGGEFSRANSYLYKGESVLLGRKGTVDKPLYINGPFWTVDTMFYTELSQSVDGRFLFYYATCFRFGQYSTNTALPSMAQEDLANIQLAVPELHEQAAIAAFLDHETARVDALVAEQQRLIELLKEKRQAVISHAVTKGLDPDVPMRYSGVEWLGEVPAHWEVSRLKHVTDRIIDCPHETPVYDPDGDFLVIRTADLEYGVLDPKLMYRLDEEQYNSRTRRSTLGCGDIVYGREGERWGHAALVPEDGKYCLGQRMMQFISSHEMGPEFLMWQLNSDNLYRQGDVDVVGATSPHVNVSTIRNYYISVPPEKEQLAISRFLKEESCAFDELVRSANSIVALLQERRSALISAAVTGKIDVRNWQGTAYDAYSEGEMLMAAEEYATYS